ncbi:MAG: hypothetical protein ABW076_09150 [Candidatus Thiodiazotropha sp.]
MPFELITTPPRSRFFRHFRRRLIQFIGVLLFVIGLAASSLPLLFSMTLAVSLFSSKVDFPDMDADQAAVFSIATLIAVTGLILGLKLIRGRRQLVLFLRRFGYDEATAALSFAAASSMGQRWRLVTLDDNQIAPILGISTRGRLLGLLRWLLLGAVAGGLFWLLGDGFGDYLGKIIGEIKHDNPDAGVQGIIGHIVTLFVMTLVLGLIIGTIALMLIALLGAGMIFSWRSFRSYKNAELGQTRSIDNSAQIQPVIERVVKLSKRIFAPRLVVLRVDSSVWQRVVIGFANVSAVILVDVSSLGEGLLWELEYLRDNKQLKVVLVGHYDRLQSIATRLPGHGNDISAEQRLIELLDGRSVLAYRSDNPSDSRRFARLLKSRLNDPANP